MTEIKQTVFFHGKEVPKMHKSHVEFGHCPCLECAWWMENHSAEGGCNNKCREHCSTCRPGQGACKKFHQLFIQISAATADELFKLSKELDWTPEELVQMAIHRWAENPNPMWEKKGATPIKTIMEISNEIAKDGEKWLKEHPEVPGPDPDQKD